MSNKDKELASKQICPKCGSVQKENIWQSDESKRVYSVLCSTCREIYRIDLEKMKVY